MPRSRFASVCLSLTLRSVCLAIMAVSLCVAMPIAFAQTTVANLGANQVTLQLTSTTTGTGYFTVLPGSNTLCGTTLQTIEGKDSNGVVAIHGSLPLTANVNSSYTVRKLTQSTAYTVCFTPDGISAPSATSVTTTAPATFTNPSWRVVGVEGFSANTSFYTSLAFSPDGTPYVAYSDSGNGGRATVMKFDGSAWVPVGGVGFSAATATNITFAFSPDGTPYIGYMDYGNSLKATVMKFDGGSWMPVGSAGFTSGIANFLSLAFSPDGAPFLAFQDIAHGSYASVMKFDGTSWVQVGSPAFSSDFANLMTLAFAPDGTPYVSFTEGPPPAKATVMKFDGTSWGLVGSEAFTPGTVSYLSLAIAQNGTPYLSFQDAANSNKTSTMKFDGSSWVQVGAAGFSAGTAAYQSLAFAPDGTPYVAYEDVANNDKVTVMKFDGSAWVPLIGAAFSSSEAVYVSFAFSPDGVPFVAYEGYGNNFQAAVMRVTDVPSVTTADATNITPQGVTLNGTALDNGLSTTVTFEYGPYTDYGTTVAATIPAGGRVSPGAGSTAVAAVLTGLPPNTVYHVRANAIANGVTIHGNDVTFATGQYPSSVITPPAASPITFGESLDSSTLSGGAGSVDGEFFWTDYSITPPGVGTFSYSVTFYPYDGSYAMSTAMASVRVNKAAPHISRAPSASAITYGQTLASSNLTGGSASTPGSFAWTTPSTKPNAGTTSFSVTFTPTDTTNYTTTTTTASVRTNKASTSITTAPTAAAITFGQRLSAATLSGGVGSVPGSFAFTSPNTSPNAGTASFSVTFTPTDSTNYNTSTVQVSVTTNKATPTITTMPKASAITFGQTLASSTLSGGVASVAGTFAWTTPATRPDAGTASYSVTFTPTSTANNNTITTTVSVTVSKAATSITTAPAASALTYGQTLAASTLSGGVGSVAGTFAWTTPGTLPAVGTQNYSVTFTPTDATNYNTATAMVSVTTAKATPTITTGPAAATIAYTQTLASSTLSGGAASTAGTFTWTTPATVPPVGTTSYAVLFTPTDTANYNTVATTASVTVTKAAAGVVLGILTQAYTGSPLPVSVTTLPAGLNIVVTYNGSITVPQPIGNYAVVATVNDANYTGSATGSMIIAPAGNPQLAVTTAVAKLGGSGYAMTVTVKNSGTGTARGVVLTSALIGTTGGTTLPANMGDIAPGSSAIVVLNYPSTIGVTGAPVAEKLTGTYTGGSFNAALRAVLP